MAQAPRAANLVRLKGGVSQARGVHLVAGNQEAGRAGVKTHFCHQEKGNAIRNAKINTASPGGSVSNCEATHIWQGSGRPGA